MNTNLTEIIFILDRSGSMGHLTEDTIGGYNSFLNQQKKEEGEAVVTTVLFDDLYEVLHDGKDIKKINELTDKEYFARGMTALLDAVGKTISNKISKVRKQKECEKAGKVIFVIITDGYENASREYSYSFVKKLIEHQKEKYKWEFIFIGANIDAAEEGAKMGISKERTAKFKADSKGTQAVYREMAFNVSDYRQKGEISEDWNLKIEEDE